MSKIKEEKDNLILPEDHNYGSVTQKEAKLPSPKNPPTNPPDNPPLPPQCTTSDVINFIGFGKYQIIILFVMFMGFCCEHALLDMIPVLSTRLYVELDLTPELESTLGTVTFFGLTFSIIINGFLANKFGRKTSTIASSVWMIFWSILCSVSWNDASLIAFRFMFSFGGGCMHVFQPHIYEAFPPNLIWVALLISHYIGEGSGRLLTYILGLAIFSTNDHENTWRLYIIILSLPAAVFIVSALLFLDESPRYLVSKGQNEKALAVLHKIAKTNSKQLPEIEKLELEPELGALQEDKTSFWEKLKSVVQTWDILRGMTCIVMIGISCKYITNQMGLVATELVFMSGQSDTTYCDGTEENTYFLDTQDYFILSIFTLVTILAQTLAIIPTYRINFDFKISTVIFLAVSICLVAFLYACPEVWVALLIFSIVQVISVVLELNMSIHLSGLLPTNTRSAVYGMTTFIMYLPLSASPYLIQVLSKESQHYVTTTTISFIGFGFIGALLLPRKIYHNK